MSNLMGAIERMWADVDAIQRQDYPSTMIAVRKPLVQAGWFPVETGLHADGNGQLPRKLPVGGLMIIGHHWGDVSFYQKAEMAAAPIVDPTSRNLDKLLETTSLDLPRQCWRTNAYVGLRREGMTGAIGLNGKERYLKACQKLLKAQMAAIRPRACLVLGRGPIRMVGGMIGNPQWARFSSFRRLDHGGTVVLADVGINERSATLIALVHPCIAANYRYQWRCGSSGQDAVEALITLAEGTVNTANKKSAT